MQEPAQIVLLLAVMAIAAFIYHDIKVYAHFKSLIATEARQKKFRQWLALSFSVFGVGGLLGLWFIGHISALFEMPDLLRLELTSVEDASDEEVSGLVRVFKGFSSAFTSAIFIGVLLGPVFQVFIQRAVNKKGGEATKPTVIGDVQPLMPRNKKERFWAFWIAVNAGFSEEIFYRLLLFICLTTVTGNIWVGIVGSTLLFGITHYYQGWVGVVGTTVFGAFCMLLYLLTQNIWMPIALHVLLDINALLVMPWISRLNA